MRQGIGLSLLLGLLGLFGCMDSGKPRSPSIIEVMQNCQTLQKFDEFNYCIQTTYIWDSRHRSVEPLFAELNAIQEYQRLGKITHTNAKALAYKAYDATVGAENRERDRRRRELQAALIGMGGCGSLSCMAQGATGTRKSTSNTNRPTPKSVVYKSGQSKNAKGQTLCSYKNGTVINNGYDSMCPTSIPDSF